MKNTALYNEYNLTILCTKKETSVRLITLSTVKNSDNKHYLKQ